MPTDARPLPKRVPVSGFCGSTRPLDQSVPVNSLPRLSALLAEPAGTVAVRLGGRRDTRGACWVQGRIEGVLCLQCEHCMDVFDWPLALDLEIRVVAGEQEEARMIAEADTWMAQDDALSMAELVEDEIILALPLVARCTDATCGDAPRTF